MRINLFRSLLLALAIFAVSAASSAQVLISVNFGPPALPVYEQPPCPGEDYIWTPGYWAWSPAGYYWVPGTWVLAPDPGLLWTPGYWAFENSLYYWHPGYWGPTVGYYGGIDYGFGYPGTGYYGGYWRDRHFFYNQAVSNVNAGRIHYVYRTAVPEVRAATRVSFNGPGGTNARPTPQQEATARERHVAATSVQMQNEWAASTNRQLLAKVNEGRPPVAATAKPATFSGGGVVGASRAGALYRPPENRAAPENRVAPQPRAAAPRTPARNQPAAPAPSTSRATPPPARTPQPGREVRPNNPRPAPERAPEFGKQVRPENAPRPQSPPPRAANRPVPPPAERVPQARPERAPEARPERAAPAPKHEARPPERKPAPEEEHPR